VTAGDRLRKRVLARVWHDPDNGLLVERCMPHRQQPPHILSEVRKEDH